MSHLRAAVRIEAGRALLDSWISASSSSSEIMSPRASCMSVSPSCRSHRSAMRQANSFHSTCPFLSRSSSSITCFTCAHGRRPTRSRTSGRRSGRAPSAGRGDISSAPRASPSQSPGAQGSHTPSSVIGLPSCCMTVLSSVLSLQERESRCAPRAMCAVTGMALSGMKGRFSHHMAQALAEVAGGRVRSLRHSRDA